MQKGKDRSRKGKDRSGKGKTEVENERIEAGKRRR